MHPDDAVKVDRQIEAAKREAIATGLRMQASSLKGIAETMRLHAGELEDHAKSIEQGAKTDARPVRQQERDGDDEVLVPIDGETLQTVGIDELDVSQPMKEWLRQFHERYRRSPHFAPIVNEMAEHGHELNEQTARVVAGLVQTRTAATATTIGDDDG